MSRKRDLVQVDWVDSTTFHGWHAAEQAAANRDMRCSSVGFMTESETNHIAISAHIAWPDRPNPNVNNTMTIPRCAITRIRKLGAKLEEPAEKRRRG